MAFDDRAADRDTLARQGRALRLPGPAWQRFWDAAAATPGMEGWAVYAGSQMAAFLVSVQFDDTVEFMLARSRSDCLDAYPNNALIFEVARELSQPLFEWSVTSGFRRGCGCILGRFVSSRKRPLRDGGRQAHARKSTRSSPERDRIHRMPRKPSGPRFLRERRRGDRLDARHRAREQVEPGACRDRRHQVGERHGEEKRGRGDEQHDDRCSSINRRGHGVCRRVRGIQLFPRRACRIRAGLPSCPIPFRSRSRKISSRSSPS